MPLGAAKESPPQIPMTTLHIGSYSARESWDWDNSPDSQSYHAQKSSGKADTTPGEHPAPQHDDAPLLPARETLDGEAEGDVKTRIRRLDRVNELSQWSSEHWVFEVSALFISAICLMGIVTTLMLHGNRPLPQWLFGIKINALISALSTVSRSALAVAVSAAISQRQWVRLSRGTNPLADLEMHDNASRGPWGSMSLLFSLGWSDTVSLGALITVLSLAIDPFIQQITTFESAPAPFGTSNISSRIIFETGVNSTDGRIFNQGFVQAPESFNPHIYQGLYFDGDLTNTLLRNALQIHPRSSGGNVSFGVSESLAMCSECANITSYLSPPKAPTNVGDCDGSDKGCWSWTLPNKVSSGWTQFGDRSTNVLSLTTSADTIVLDTSGRLTILNLTAIMPGWEITVVDSEQQPREAVGVQGQAQECMLYWCVNKYESSLSGGVFNETIISSFSTGAIEPEPYSKVFSIKPPGSNSSLFLPNSHEYGDFPTKWINGTFLINIDAHGLIQKPLGDLFSGYATTLNSYQEWAPISNNPTLARVYTKARRHDPPETPQFDMQEIFDAIALGMSTVLRMPDPTHDGTDTLQSVVGTETVMQVVVRVRWAWFILPVVLQLAAYIFFCQTVVISHRRKLRNWKSSALAVFFFGARMGNEVRHRGVERWIDMIDVAKNQVLVVEGRKPTTGIKENELSV